MGRSRSRSGAEGMFAEKLIPTPRSENHSMVVYAEAAVHNLDRRPRPCLNGKTSCQVFFSPGETGFFEIGKEGDL